MALLETQDMALLETQDMAPLEPQDMASLETHAVALLSDGPRQLRLDFQQQNKTNCFLHSVRKVPGNVLT